MKKQYIQPESHTVVVNLMGSVLETRPIGTASEEAMTMYSREDQYNDRFEDTEEDWEWE